MKTIKQIAEEICPNPTWDLGGHKQKQAYDRDWLNRVTRAEKILEQFKAEIEANYVRATRNQEKRPTGDAISLPR